MSSTPKIRDNVRSLTGAEKTAIIFLTLGEERGARLMEQLDDDEIRMVSRAMSTLGNVTSNLVEQLLRSFTERFAQGGTVIGSFENTERMLNRFLPADRVGEIMNEIRGPAGRTMWEKLSNVNEQALASFLVGEYPQTIAVVLSRLRPEHAARILPHLPRDLLLDVVERMISIESVQRDMLADVEELLHSEFMVNYARSQGNNPHERMAEIFNRTERETLEQIMGDLEQEIPEAAQKIKQLMFTFEDLIRLDASSLQTLIRSCDTHQLAVALKGAQPPLRAAFLDILSDRGRLILEEEIDSLGPLRMREVQEAQSDVLALAKALAADGSIVLPQDEQDEVVA